MRSGFLVLWVSHEQDVGITMSRFESVSARALRSSSQELVSSVGVIAEAS